MDGWIKKPHLPAINSVFFNSLLSKSYGLTRLKPTSINATAMLPPSLLFHYCSRRL